jgi:hypothetical protein
MSEAHNLTDALQPWIRHHDLTRLQTQQYLSIGATKFYALVAEGLLETYRLGPDGKGSQRVVRESIEKLRRSRANEPASDENRKQAG